jgi:hypothetical protein
VTLRRAARFYSSQPAGKEHDVSDAQTDIARGRYLPTIAHQRHLDAVLAEVATERGAQDAQWGGPEHDDCHDWHEWADLIHIHASCADETVTPTQYRLEMVRVAALAVAAVQSLDRERLPATL